MKKNQNDIQLLKKLEDLSSIKVEEDKKETVIGYINSVSEWFKVLASIDTSKVDCLMPKLDNFNDPNINQCDNILKNTNTEYNYFVVPKVIGE